MTRETTQLFGDDHVHSWASIGEDAFGNALGNAVIAGMQQPSSSAMWSDYQRTQAYIQGEQSIDNPFNGLSIAPMGQMDTSNPLSIYSQLGYGSVERTATAKANPTGSDPAAVAGNSGPSTWKGGYSVPASYDGIDPSTQEGKALIDQLHGNTVAYVNYMNTQQGQAYPSPPDAGDWKGLIEYNHTLQQWLSAQQNTQPTVVVTPASELDQDAQITAGSREASAQFFDQYRGSFWGDLGANAGTLLTDGGNSLIGAGRSLIDIATDYQSFRQVAVGTTMAVAHPVTTYNRAVDAMADWYALPLDQQARSIGDAGMAMLTFGGVDAAAAKTIAYAGETASTIRSLSAPGALDTSFLEAPQGVSAPLSAPRSESLGLRTLNPSEVSFTQSWVSYQKRGASYYFDSLVESMRTNGWVGKPIDAVQMPDGTIATIDNTRVLAARQAGIEVQANVRGFDELIADPMRQATLRVGGNVPSTWGDAALLRINNPYQNMLDRNGGVVNWSQRFPMGSIYDPHVY